MARKHGQAFRLSGDVGADRRSWVQVLRTGRWWDERYGWFEVTPATLSALVRNHGRAGVTFADYDHGIAYADGSGNAIAAGEILELEIRPGEGQDERGEPLVELWALVEWTERAAEAIRRQEYRYTSAWYHPNYKTNQGEEIGPTLLGFAITNRPVIDSMAPLALNERGAAMALSATFIAFAERVGEGNGPKGQDEEVEMADNTKPQDRGAWAWLLGKVGLGPNASETDLGMKVDELQGQVRTLSAERDQHKVAREAAEQLLSQVREVFGFGAQDDLLAKCKLLSQRLAEAETKATEQAITAIVEKALAEHRIAPAQKEYYLSNLRREAKEVAKVEDTPTAKLLASLSASPYAVQHAHGAEDANAGVAGDDEDREIETLAAKHLREDSDLLELARTDRARARLLADQRAIAEVEAKRRQKAGV
jgi:hypothetical protein